LVKDFWVKENTGIESASGFGSIGEIISNLLNNVYVLAGIILFILLIIGGFMVMIAAGQENPDQAKKGKQAITSVPNWLYWLFLCLLDYENH